MYEQVLPLPLYKQVLSMCEQVLPMCEQVLPNQHCLMDSLARWCSCLFCRCALPGLDNDTYESQGEWHDDMVKSQVPWDADKDAYSECQLFQFHNSTNETVSCDRWVYNQDPFETTFVTEVDTVTSKLRSLK